MYNFLKGSAKKLRPTASSKGKEGFNNKLRDDGWRSIYRGMEVFVNDGLISYIEIDYLVKSVGALMRTNKAMLSLIRNSSIWHSLGKILCPCGICAVQTRPFLGSLPSHEPMMFCRRAFYLRALRLMNAKSLVTKSCRRILDDEAIAPWNFSSVLELVKSTTAKAILMNHLGPESKSRFDSSGHIHLPDQGSIAMKEDPGFEYARSQVMWFKLSAKTVRRSVQSASSMWISLLRHLSESVCFQESAVLLQRDDSAKSTDNSSSSSSGRARLYKVRGTNEEKAEEEEGVEAEDEDEKDPPGFVSQGDSKLYFLIGSENGSRCNASISGDCFKYLSAVHVTRDKGKEVALLSIVQGGHICTAITRSSLFAPRESSFRKRTRRVLASTCGVQ